MKELKETHVQGHLSVEADIKSMHNCDFGIQIAPDGRVWICIDGQAFIRRVWICIDGQAFIRFKPKIQERIGKDGEV